MKFIFILVFALGFCGLSISQTDYFETLLVFGDDFTEESISLRGSDSSDIHLRIEHRVAITDLSVGSVIILSGNNIYLLEKFVEKYYEWLDLAKQKGVEFRKEMFNKNIHSDVEAYHWSRNKEFKFTKTDLCLDIVNITAVGDFLRLDSGETWLSIIASCESGSTTIHFNASYMSELKKLFDSNKFKNEVNKIYQLKYSWDEFEPIEED